MYYPGYVKKEDYLNKLIDQYKKEYPYFTEMQIRKPLAAVIKSIRAVVNNIVWCEPSKIVQYYKLNVLPLIISLSHEQLIELNLSNIMQYSIIFSLAKKNEDVIKRLLSRGDSPDSLPEKKCDEYLDYIEKMTKHCVLEVTCFMKKSIPYEIKKNYHDNYADPLLEKSPLDKQNKVKAKKKQVSWSSELTETRFFKAQKTNLNESSSSRKRTQSSSMEGSTSVKKAKTNSTALL